jgi:flavin-dependent thymidylate synthase
MTLPKVEVVAATFTDPKQAAAMLIFTKHTRLQMDGAGFEDICMRVMDDWDWALSELNYMAETIRSSWEFLDVTFAIRNVSRACAQQITRTRFTPIDGDLYGSYAMQSQRVTDMSEQTWHNPVAMKHGEDAGAAIHYDRLMHGQMSTYKDLMQAGYSAEDARGVLPINLHCSLVAKYNLRMLVELVVARKSYRAQGEFQMVADQMEKAVVEMWPWAETFFRPRNEIADGALQDLEAELNALGVEYNLSSDDTHSMMIRIAKIRDLVKGG